MGQLKPGVTYIYERADGVTYARESGAPASSRVAIGWDYNSAPKHDRATFLQSKEVRLWKDIRATADTNKSLQRALDRAILIYNLVKDKNERKTNN